MCVIGSDDYSSREARMDIVNSFGSDDSNKKASVLLQNETKYPVFKVANPKYDTGVK